jgi:2-keto-3-deoxy-L-fuconate dehydrogenase
MSGRLAGKQAFVTAAGAGIGRATAIAFLREGATVVAADNHAAALDLLHAEHPSITCWRLDVTDTTAVTDAAARWQQTDLLVNAVGIVVDGTVLSCRVEDWDRSLQLNVTAMFHVIRAFMPPMLRRRCGSIVNVASVASSVTGVPNRCAYGTSKAAVIGLTKSVAADFIASGIRCNAICPGTIDTPSLAARIAATGDPAAARKAFVARQPMGRLGSPEEIAHLAVYLGSDESAFTTGQIHIADGGWTI